MLILIYYYHRIAEPHQPPVVAKIFSAIQSLTGLVWLVPSTRIPKPESRILKPESRIPILETRKREREREREIERERENKKRKRQRAQARSRFRVAGISCTKSQPPPRTDGPGTYW